MFDKNVFQFQARSLRHNTGPCVQAVPFSFETTRQSLSIVVTKCSHAKKQGPGFYFLNACCTQRLKEARLINEVVSNVSFKRQLYGTRWRYLVKPFLLETLALQTRIDNKQIFTLRN